MDKEKLRDELADWFLANCFTLAERRNPRARVVGLHYVDEILEIVERHKEPPWEPATG